MNILITRPLIDSENLMEKLFSMGHKILHIPTLKIQASDFSQPTFTMNANLHAGYNS